MPNRILKESICYSDDLDRLTPFEETVFYRLMVNVDDYGRLDARTAFLKSKLFVTKQGITEKSIEEAISKLSLIGLVELYQVENKPFLVLTKWDCHQQIRAKKSKYPEPTDENICNQMISDESGCPRNPIQSESNPNPNPKGKGTHRFVPPSLEDVTAYCTERKNGVDPQRFIDFYEAKGWMVGKNKMKKWKACVRTWENRNKENSQKPFNSYRPRRQEVVPEWMQEQQQQEKHTDEVDPELAEALAEFKKG